MENTPLTSTVGRHNVNGVAQISNPTMPKTTLSHRWIQIKFVLRLVALTCALVAFVVSFVWLAAPTTGFLGDIMPPLWFIAHPVLTMAWESIEVIRIVVKKRDKASGLPPGAHVGCELILWLGGICTGAIFLSFAIPYYQDSGYFGTPGSHAWASLLLFWGAVVLVSTACQLALFILACIETDMQRRAVKQQMSRIISFIEQRGGANNPENDDLMRAVVVASSSSAAPQKQEQQQHQQPPPHWEQDGKMHAQEVPAIVIRDYAMEPVEMVAEDRREEMAGVVQAWEMEATPAGSGVVGQRVLSRGQKDEVEVIMSSHE